MVAVPADTPDTTPEVTGATGVLLLLHAPPDILLLSDVVLPAHTVAVPVIVPAETVQFAALIPGIIT
jgi:hypothetical protein